MAIKGNKTFFFLHPLVYLISEWYFIFTWFSSVHNIKAIYGQGALRYNDDKALSVFLDKNLPPEYYDKVLKAVREGKLDFLPQGTASLIRYTIENTIDPFAYAFTETQKSIGEFFVGKSKKVAT